MSYNKTILQGRLSGNPEVRYSMNGTPITDFTIAVDGYKTKDGENRVDFIRIVAFGKQAETIGQFCTKGQQVTVDGRLQVQKWQTEDGSTRSRLQVVANRVIFGAKPRQQAA